MLMKLINLDKGSLVKYHCLDLSISVYYNVYTDPYITRET